MYTNLSTSSLLTLQTLGLSSTDIYLAFVFGTLTYLIIMFSNLLVLTVIAMNKKLHKPMFILLFNLPISDIVGATAFFPHLIFSIVTENRLISHHACIIQAFLIHMSEWQKAIQTCVTHLIVFLSLQINTVFALISHRIDSSSPVLRRAFGVSVLIFPPFLNPIIYGLKTKELKQCIVMFLKRNVGLTK